MSDFMDWVTHGIKRGRFEVNRRTALYIVALVAVLTVVAVLYLMLVSQTAARGRRIERLRQELVWLKKENEHLEVKIAEESAVSNLLKRASAQGFRQVEQVDFAELSVETSP